jgi:hypothetical protein
MCDKHCTLFKTEETTCFFWDFMNYARVETVFCSHETVPVLLPVIIQFYVSQLCHYMCNFFPLLQNILRFWDCNVAYCVYDRLSLKFSGGQSSKNTYINQINRHFMYKGARWHKFGSVYWESLLYKMYHLGTELLKSHSSNIPLHCDIGGDQGDVPEDLSHLRYYSFWILWSWRWRHNNPV